MPKWQSLKTGASFSVLTVAFASSVCSGANRGLGDPAAAVVAAEVCVVGRPTREGVECQAFRGGGGRLYTLIGDIGNIADGHELCVCGELVEISSCMQGTTIAVRRVGTPDSCR
jgi:hypothetical protein